MTITKAQLDHWRALAEAATKGPWQSHIDDEWPDEVTLRAKSALPTDEGRVPGTCRPTDVIYQQDLDDDEADAGQRIADAFFIAAARTAVPALLDEFDRVRVLHSPAYTITGIDYCSRCGHDYPCPTIQTIEGENDD